LEGGLRSRTIVPIEQAQAQHTLRHEDTLLLLGSCFSDEVGARLEHLGHPASYNPLGTMFNPASIERTVDWIASGEPATSESVARCDRQGLYYCYDAGTGHSHEDEEACVAGLNQSLEEARATLSDCKALFLTLGSAWTYVLRSTGKIVANCHRQPHSQFERRLLEPAAVAEHVHGAVESARRVNPGLRVVLTVSPVRHWREGAVASSRSKAVLLTAVHQVCDAVPGASYFPSYEVVMDELRDYRWFADDMLHPSAAAVDYVTRRLLRSHFASADDHLRSEVSKIRAAANHRHARPHSTSARDFAQRQLAEANRIGSACPYVHLDDEIAWFRSMAA